MIGAVAVVQCIAVQITSIAAVLAGIPCTVYPWFFPLLLAGWMARRLAVDVLQRAVVCIVSLFMTAYHVQQYGSLPVRL